MAYAIRHHGQASTASGLDLLAAIWLLISPFALAFISGGWATTNNVVVGIIVGILAIYRLGSAPDSVWASWCNLVLGLWVIASPWILGFAGSHVPMTNNVITGICIAVLAFWSATAGSSNESNARTNDQPRM